MKREGLATAVAAATADAAPWIGGQVAIAAPTCPLHRFATAID